MPQKCQISTINTVTDAVVENTVVAMSCHDCAKLTHAQHFLIKFLIENICSRALLGEIHYENVDIEISENSARNGSNIF